MTSKIGAVYDPVNIYNKEEVLKPNNYSDLQNNNSRTLSESDFNPLNFFNYSMPNINPPSWYQPLYNSRN